MYRWRLGRTFDCSRRWDSACGWYCLSVRIAASALSRLELPNAPLSSLASPGRRAWCFSSRSPRSRIAVGPLLSRSSSTTAQQRYLARTSLEQRVSFPSRKLILSPLSPTDPCLGKKYQHSNEDRGKRSTYSLSYNRSYGSHPFSKSSTERTTNSAPSGHWWSLRNDGSPVSWTRVRRSTTIRPSFGGKASKKRRGRATPLFS